MKPRWMLLSLLLTPVMLAAEMRFWTNTSGQIVEAEMTGVNPARRAVQVRLKGGSTAEIPIENLNQPDKDYAKQQWAVMQTAGGGAPAPAQAPASNLTLPPRLQSRATADARLAKVLECGRPAWKKFAATVLKQTVAAQDADGSFKRGRPNWPAGDTADATYRQALCTLLLETPYGCALK